MESEPPMNASTYNPTRQGFAASGDGIDLTEKEKEELARELARLFAERRARDIFITHARSPLDRALRGIRRAYSSLPGMTRRGR